MKARFKKMWMDIMENMDIGIIDARYVNMSGIPGIIIMIYTIKAVYFNTIWNSGRVFFLHTKVVV
ncbi:hypothetical protein EMIT07CA2_550089 [Brevibacillus sp. IT-7CA2]